MFQTTERRLHDRLTRLLPAGEELRAALVIFTGPRPGSEGLAMMAGMIGMWFVQRRRTFFTLAVTDRGVVRFRNKGPRRPSQLLDRFELNQLRPDIGKGIELALELDGKRFWMEGIWSGELRKIRRLVDEAG